MVAGMMPSVGEGSLSELCRLDLWRQTSMMWMMGGNLAFSVFYVLMGLITSPEPAPECRLSNAGFMACTNGVAVAAFSCFVAVQPSLRMQFASAYGLNTAGASSNGRRGGRREEQPKVHWAARAMSMAAECCNYVAMFAISFAFNLHPNAGLVAAGRASLNQMTNCVCAWLLHHCYRCVAVGSLLPVLRTMSASFPLNCTKQVRPTGRGARDENSLGGDCDGGPAAGV